MSSLLLKTSNMLFNLAKKIKPDTAKDLMNKLGVKNMDN